MQFRGVLCCVFCSDYMFGTQFFRFFYTCRVDASELKWSASVRSGTIQTEKTVCYVFSGGTVAERSTSSRDAAGEVL